MDNITRLTSNKLSSNSRYRLLLILIAAFFVISGMGEITKNPSTYSRTISMGYPPFFILTLGISKLLGAIALVQPKSMRLREWAFAGFTFDVIFAFISGLSIGSYTDCVKALIVLMVLMGSYALLVKK